MNDKIKEIYGGKVRVRTCGICIKNDALLLVKHHGLGKKRVLWLPPGGGVEYGEAVSKTLKREFLEETGLHIEVGDFLFVNELIQPPLHAIELFFLVEIVKGELLLGRDPEMEEADQIIKEVKFVPFDELRIMDNEILHNTLHAISDEETLLNMRGYFKISQ